jgi:magnesium transporter
MYNEILTQYLEGSIVRYNINSASFLLSISLRAAIYFLKFLKEIKRRTTLIEDELQQSMRNKELIRMVDEKIPCFL